VRTINLKLGIAVTLDPRTRPILGGTVKGNDIELFPTVLCPSKTFWRQLKFAGFGVSCGGVVACVTC